MGKAVSALKMVNVIVLGKGEESDIIPTIHSPGFHPTGFHVHGCVEMCFAFEGRCRLMCPSERMELGKRKLAVILPAVPHCEARWRKNVPYDLLWLVLIEESCSTFVSRYQPGLGWNSLGRNMIRHPAVRQVSETVVQMADESDRFRWQGNLLIVLAELLHRVQATQAHSERSDYHGELIGQVREYLNANFGKPLSLTSLGALFRLSPNHLNSLFVRYEGVGIHGYLLEKRLNVAEALLREESLSVKQVAYRCGFTDPLYFSKACKRRFGLPPIKMRG